MNNNTIKEEINETYKKLLIKNLSFEEWNQDQQYFGSILYLGILTIKEIYNFSCGLIYSKVNCSTKNDKDELTNKKEGIKRFTKKYLILTILKIISLVIQTLVIYIKKKFQKKSQKIILMKM